MQPNQINGSLDNSMRPEISTPTQASVAGTFSPTEQSPPKQNSLNVPNPQSDLPVPVVQVLSVRGVEYTMMTLCLWLLAGGLLWALLSVFNGLNSFSVLAFPIALMLVTLPFFVYLFIRLKKAEQHDPALRLDASKRRLSQFTQIITFATCLFNLIGFAYMMLTNISGESSVSIGKSVLNLVIVLVIAGGILAYYWVEEHRISGQK